MTTRASVGKSNKRSSAEAGREAAENAMAQLGVDRASIVLVFATAGYDQAACLAGVTEITHDAPLAGCSGEGVITQTGADEGSHAVAVMVIASSNASFDTYQVSGFSRDARACGAELARRLRPAAEKRPRLLLLFPDGLTGNCTELLGALKAELPFPVAIAGGAAGDAMTLKKTYQYFNGTVSSDSVTAVLISGDITAETAVSHGCEPIGLERSVTHSEGGQVFEIDGRRAWDVFKEYLDEDTKDLTSADVVHLCVGQTLPGGGDPRFGKYVIRTPLGLDKESGALFFPGGLEEGTKIQLTRRDPIRIEQSARETAQTIAASHQGRAPSLVLQFDCAGRGGVIFGKKTTEIAVTPIQETLGKTVPWLGFHTYGELAELGGKPYYHNYTVVLCALYDTGSAE
jgi:hypothetical protein